MTLDKTDLTWEARHEQATITQCQAAWAQSHKELELFYFQTTSRESPMKMYGGKGRAAYTCYLNRREFLREFE